MKTAFSIELFHQRSVPSCHTTMGLVLVSFLGYSFEILLVTAGSAT
jgi:hypothetical protein